MIDPTHKEIKKTWNTPEEYEQWLKDNTYENSRLTPLKTENKPKSTSDKETQHKTSSITTTTTTNKETKQQKTIELQSTPQEYFTLRQADVLDQARLRPLR